MATITKVFKPHRGKVSTMAGSKASVVLKDGEMFVEVPDSGSGAGHCKIKMGNGSTAYSSLPYAIGDTSNDLITYTADTSTTVTAALSDAASGNKLGTIVAGLKQAVSLCNTSITTLNDEYNTISSRVTTLETDFQTGCSTIAAAITAKGITTASNASPSTMATNIASISTGISIKSVYFSSSSTIDAYTYTATSAGVYFVLIQGFGTTGTITSTGTILAQDHLYDNRANSYICYLASGNTITINIVSTMSNYKEYQIIREILYLGSYTTGSKLNSSYGGNGSSIGLTPTAHTSYNLMVAAGTGANSNSCTFTNITSTDTSPVSIIAKSSSLWSLQYIYTLNVAATGAYYCSGGSNGNIEYLVQYTAS